MIGLIKSPAKLMHEHDGNVNACMTVFRAQKKWHTSHQSDGLSQPEHFERFKNQTDSVEQFGGATGQHLTLMNRECIELHGKDSRNCTKEELQEARDQVREKMLEVTDLKNANKKMIRPMMANMENNHLMDNGTHPLMLTKAHNVSLHCKRDGTSGNTGGANGNYTGVSFAQQGKNKVVECHGWVKKGVKKCECPVCDPT